MVFPFICLAMLSRSNFIGLRSRRFRFLPVGSSWNSIHLQPAAYRRNGSDQDIVLQAELNHFLFSLAGHIERGYDELINSVVQQHFLNLSPLYIKVPSIFVFGPARVVIHESDHLKPCSSVSSQSSLCNMSGSPAPKMTTRLLLMVPRVTSNWMNFTINLEPTIMKMQTSQSIIMTEVGSRNFSVTK